MLQYLTSIRLFGKLLSQQAALKAAMPNLREALGMKAPGIAVDQYLAELNA